MYEYVSFIQFGQTCSLSKLLQTLVIPELSYYSTLPEAEFLDVTGTKVLRVRSWIRLLENGIYSCLTNSIFWSGSLPTFKLLCMWVVTSGTPVNSRRFSKPNLLKFALTRAAAMEPPAWERSAGAGCAERAGNHLSPRASAHSQACRFCSPPLGKSGIDRGPTELVQHSAYRGSSHRRTGAASHIIDTAVWLYRSPFPVRRKGVFYLFIWRLTSLAAPRGGGGFVLDVSTLVISHILFVFLGPALLHPCKTSVEKDFFV